MVSDRYKLYVTPPDFTSLTIWTLICLFNITLYSYVTYKNVWKAKSYIPLNIINVTNAVFVGVWCIGNSTSLVACSLIVLLLPAGLLSLWVSLYEPNENSWMYYSMRNVVAFYLGWMLVSCVYNFGYVLTYILGMSQKEFTIIFWGIAPSLLLGTTIMNIVMQGCNGFKSTIFLWVSGLWGLAGSFISTLGNKENL
jgi:hypothetical protein